MTAKRHWSGALATHVEHAAQHIVPTMTETGHDGAIMPHGPAATDHSLRLVRAMIAAAKADGKLTDDERERLLDRIGPAQFDPDVQDWLQREFRAKLDIEAVVEGCCDSPRRSVEIYLASLMAIDLDAEARPLRHLHRAVHEGRALADRGGDEVGPQRVVVDHALEGAEGLGGGRELQRLVYGASSRVNLDDVGFTLGQGACFIERGRANPGEHL